MMLVAGQFEAEIRQLSDYNVTLGTHIAISDKSCILFNIGMSKVFILLHNGGLCVL